MARRIEEMSPEQKKAMMTKIMSGKRTGIKKGSITSGKKYSHSTMLKIIKITMYQKAKLIKK